MSLSYSQKLYYKAIAKLLVVPLVLIISSSLMLWYVGNMILASATMIYGVALFTGGFFFYPVLKKLDTMLDARADPLYEKDIVVPIMKERDSAKKGIEGEEIVSSWLGEILPKSDWIVIKNQAFKGDNGSEFDIDIIIVGPMGVFVLEVKNSSYDFLFTTQNCEVLVGDHYLPYSGTDPRIQVANNADTIKKRLKMSGLGDISAKRAVVFARSNSMRFHGKPTVFLIDNKESMRKYLLESFDEDPRFTFEFREKVRRSIQS